MKSALLLALALLGGLAAITMTPSPAGAIDCAAANTVSEKAICASPETIKVDAAMASAYEALLAQSTASER